MPAARATSRTDGVRSRLSHRSSRARHSRRNASVSSAIPTLYRRSAPPRTQIAPRAGRARSEKSWAARSASHCRTTYDDPRVRRHMPETMTLAQARALWWHKQALAGATKGSLPAVIGDSGWLRTLGGTDVYIAARARRPGMKRAELDAAVAAGELRVQPAVRGCIYLVPSAAVPDLLALNAEAWRTQTEKELAKIGKTIAVVETLAPAVLAALTEPLTPDAIRKAFRGDIPSFGDAGKKVGLSSPRPLALRLLEFAGKIERTLDNGRLDSERYLWRKTAGKLAAPAREHDQRVANVVDAFLGFAGPATLAQLSAWSGRAQRDLKTAIGKLDTTAVEVEGLGEAYVRSADRTAKPPPPRGTALLAFEDNYLVNHGVSAVADLQHHAIDAQLWGGKGGRG